MHTDVTPAGRPPASAPLPLAAVKASFAGDMFGDLRLGLPTVRMYSVDSFRIMNSFMCFSATTEVKKNKKKPGM
jgi:hypothetical protein